VVDLVIEELSKANQHEAAALIRAGLTERWGDLDPNLNSDLDNMTETYSTGLTILVRGNEGQLIGTGTLTPRPSSTAEIVRMSVAPAARGQGVGRMMVEELLATARDWGCERIVLETTSSWTDAVEFYQRCGFVLTHHGPDEFGPQTFFEYRLSSPTN